jgi:hypothetical protein
MNGSSGLYLFCQLANLGICSDKRHQRMPSRLGLADVQWLVWLRRERWAYPKAGGWPCSALSWRFTENVPKRREQGIFNSVLRPILADSATLRICVEQEQSAESAARLQRVLMWRGEEGICQVIFTVMVNSLVILIILVVQVVLVRSYNKTAIILVFRVYRLTLEALYLPEIVYSVIS